MTDNEREPAITEMIDLVRQADQKVREMPTATKNRSAKDRKPRWGIRRAVRRALKR